jgi:hypothetical protein
MERHLEIAVAEHPMTTFDINQVKEFSAEVAAELDECESEIRCETIDNSLSIYAERCCKFSERVKKWSRDVFAGNVAYDPAAESQWKAEVHQLFFRAQRVLEIGREAESECGGFTGKRKLEAALWNLSQLVYAWVAPKLAVGPSARQRPAFSDEERARVDLLPRLPADWIPKTQQQALLLRGRPPR